MICLEARQAAVSGKSAAGLGGIYPRAKDGAIPSWRALQIRKRKAAIGSRTADFRAKVGEVDGGAHSNDRRFLLVYWPCCVGNDRPRLRVDARCRGQ